MTTTEVSGSGSYSIKAGFRLKGRELWVFRKSQKISTASDHYELCKSTNSRKYKNSVFPL